MMLSDQAQDIGKFCFRDLDHGVLIGTASDRYAGWIGQIYSPDRYDHRIKRRKKAFGKKTFVEEVLPVECVEEYFQHFRVLELDSTFYRPLLDKEGGATPNFHVLRTYSEYLGDDDRLILKVPQAVSARKLMRGGKYVENPDYLDAELFTQQFYRPSVELLGPSLAGFVFEQEYQRKDERLAPDKVTSQLDAFFEQIPRDDRYHVELRTDSFLAPPLFDVMERHGIGQVLSHWTWLPTLARQFEKSGNRILNAGNTSIIRILTPRGMRYEEAYAAAHPFDSMVDGMMTAGMVEETVRLMLEALRRKVRIHVIVNNRAGGNAPLIAQQIAGEFLTLSNPSAND